MERAQGGGEGYAWWCLSKGIEGAIKGAMGGIDSDEVLSREIGDVNQRQQRYAAERLRSGAAVECWKWDDFTMGTNPQTIHSALVFVLCYHCCNVLDGVCVR